jgi:hypothetical protein
MERNSFVGKVIMSTESSKSFDVFLKMKLVDKPKTAIKRDKIEVCGIYRC